MINFLFPPKDLKVKLTCSVCSKPIETKVDLVMAYKKYDYFQTPPPYNLPNYYFHQDCFFQAGGDTMYWEFSTTQLDKIEYFFSVFNKVMWIFYAGFLGVILLQISERELKYDILIGLVILILFSFGEKYFFERPAQILINNVRQLNKDI